MEYKDECCASGSKVLGSVSKALHSEWLFRSNSHCVTFTLRNKIYSRPKGQKTPRSAYGICLSFNLALGASSGKLRFPPLP